MRLQFRKLEPPPWVAAADWSDWKWQFRHALKTEEDFARQFQLSESERQGFAGAGSLFQVRVTPYYAQLASGPTDQDPIRLMLMPTAKEMVSLHQQMADPLGERRHSPVSRVVHRYPDRCLLLVTDFCSMYCRYCTRKHFTGNDQAFLSARELDAAVEHIRKQTSIREVILSGGDPLTLSDGQLEKVLGRLRGIEHVEIIRVGTRIPVVAPQRVTEDLVKMLRVHKPIFLMTHFNHPRELTEQAAMAVERFVDHGIPVMNQMVLLNGVNNHPAIVQALSRRLLFLRAKPYYMFQCDPSLGTDHLRTSVDNSLQIQRELWGRLSGLAMPNLSLDIPEGGGKVGLVPDFLESQRDSVRTYRGWDGVVADYVSPPESEMRDPADVAEYLEEWEQIRSQRGFSV